MITQRGRFLIRYEEPDLDYIANFDFQKLEEEYQRLKVLYNLEKDITTIRICFVYSPLEYEFFAQKKFSLKGVWAGTKRDFIFIFAPSVCEKFTTHKKEQIFQTLKHELCHIIYWFSGFKNSIFNEGLAYYFSGMKMDCKDLTPSLLLSNDYIENSKNGLFLSKMIIESIEGGRDRILGFLKKLNSNEEIYKLFEEEFGIKFSDFINERGYKRDVR